jgi:hypothetical protein
MRLENFVSVPYSRQIAQDMHEFCLATWSSQSPDLNAIDYLWNHLDKRVRQRQLPSQTLDQLCQMLQQEWL